MGKKRNRNNRRKKKKHMLMHLRSQSIARAVEDETEWQHYKAEQKKHLKTINELKADLLSRTVLVGSVLPLAVEKNRIELKIFLERTYGRVQKLGIDNKRRGKFPPSRVTFNTRKDAEKIFGGSSLMNASKKRTQVRVPCRSVGYKGSITIRPSPEYKGMVQEDLNTSTKIQINTGRLSLGHWFPRGSDACMNIPGLEHIASAEISTWVEECPTDTDPILIIDTEKAVIEIDVTHCVQSEMDAMFAALSGLFESRSRTVLSFRFKDLAQPIELCRHKKNLSRNDTFCLVFALKYPPRLNSILTNHETGYESRTRLVDMTGIDGSSDLSGIGSCLGYMVKVSTVEVNRLANARSFERIKNMGVFRCQDEWDLVQQAQLIEVEKESSHKRSKLDAKLASFHDHRLGLLIRSVLDSQSCSWFDILADKVHCQDLFGLVKEGECEKAEKILNEMKDLHGKTRHPANMFHTLYEADADEDELPRQVPEFCISLPRVLIAPLRVNVTGFETEMSNRLVRKFIEDIGFSSEAFVRASLGDENGDKMFSDDLSKAVEERIKSLVLNGIVLGKKKYVFLAYSSSQLKEHSMWLVCPEKGWSVAKIRNSMGDFSMCKTAAKYAARMGQCFSTTIDTSFGGIESGRGLAGLLFGFNARTNGNTKSLRVKDDLPDITSVSNGQLVEHSDGVGLIRKEKLNEIFSHVSFGPKKYKKDVSAIQIRYGGAKGVLVAWDFEKLKDRRINDYDVCLRPSMVKFAAKYDSVLNNNEK